MGTDIHMIVEVRDPVTNKWTRKIGGGIYGSPEHEENFSERNYDLFAMLANVRNGTWGQRFEPICEPRGLPDDRDVSGKIKTYSMSGPGDELVDFDDGFYGDHSFTWLTLEEILAYHVRTLDKPYNCKATVSREEKARLKPGEVPSSYSGGGWDGAPLPTHEWVETYKDRICVEWWRFLNRIRKLAKEPKDIRLVFGFDS
jgi:hypothetical protein